jgi:hypothetical protein
MDSFLCMRQVRNLSLWSFVLASFVSVAATANEVRPSSRSSSSATHKQSKVVTVANSREGQKLEDFCIDEKGRILALLGPVNSNDSEAIVEVEEPTSESSGIARLLGIGKKAPHFESAVHVYDSDGDLIEKWPLGFSGQAINTSPDGTILVGGNGRVARFDSSGKKLFETESPQMTYINNNPDEMRERAKEQLQSDRELFAQNLKQFQDQLDRLQKSKTDRENNQNSSDTNAPSKSKKTEADEDDDNDDDDNDGPQMSEANLKIYVQAYKQQLEIFEKKTVDQALTEVMARARRINAIASSTDEVFVTCPAMAGYGYGIWRTDRDFQNAKEIVKRLSGCCGQMDVQCCGNEVYVCENSRHRVIRFDREGKEVGKFGKRDREGEGENFGGCCNPMNLCFSKSGDLYVSESDGVVKHFTPDGECKGIVGVANVQPGCKNSCVAMTADDRRLFYIDILKSQIIILARIESDPKELGNER